MKQALIISRIESAVSGSGTLSRKQFMTIVLALTIETIAIHAGCS
ncbi:hypothetical protein [Nostoc sp.]